MAINKNHIKELLENHRFEDLFIEELGWDEFKRAYPLDVNDTRYELQPVAQKRGFVALHCPSIPDAATRAKIENKVSKDIREHLIIFTESSTAVPAVDPTGGTPVLHSPPMLRKQRWQWVRRIPGQPLSRKEHEYLPHQPMLLIERIGYLEVPVDEEDHVDLIDMFDKVKTAFNIDKVTKKFYERFKKEHDAFLTFIDGIADMGDAQWYASVMLNRLMFIYFIQKKGFLDGDTDYLRDRLARVQELKGKGKFHTFYRYFMLSLCHEVLAKKERTLDKDLAALIGNVPYLNGGIFEPHELELKYGDEIDISDEAFEKMFNFFDQYEWHLDNRPNAPENEINPDVLGYIFEKYINQKQMGAYYTKEDITEYISKNTIIPCLFDKAQKACTIAFEGETSVWNLLKADPDRYIYPSVRHGVTYDIHSDAELAKPVSYPSEIEMGLDTTAGNLLERRKQWNTQTPPEAGLPTEIWRETVARRQRYAEVKEKLESGDVQSINDLITLNLDIRQFAQDVIERCESPDLLNAFWVAIAGRMPQHSNEEIKPSITVLDPTCGSGAFLFAALNILEPLYEACLERMKGFLEEWGNSSTAVSAVNSTGESSTAVSAVGFTGVPPVLRGTPVLPPALHYFNPAENLSISQRNLPHWEQDNALYFITFRLADSLPKEKLAQWIEERERWLKTHSEPWSKDDAEEYAQLFPNRLNCWLDAGSGSCILQQPEIGKIVESALHHFDGTRYNLHDFVVMPNHVHVLVQQLPGNELSKILHSWKSFTAHEINKRLNQTGTIWQDESYDHLVRSETEHRHYKQYIADNPKKAKLKQGAYILHSSTGSSTAVPAVNSTGETPVPPPVLRETPTHRPKHPNYTKFFTSILTDIGKHPSPKYFIYKSIIIHNLYGVDIMKEAVEICKLRLFLKLVAQVEDGNRIEPLPDIDFNIRAGNTLVGFATEDEMKRAMQGDLLAYATVLPEILEQAEDCDSLFNLFREAQLEGDGSLGKAKAKLSGKLDELNDRLNVYLAEDYGIKSSTAVPAVNPTGGTPVLHSPAMLQFLETHQPFHWFIEFYGILKNGGFDTIIGNPPWKEYSAVKRTYAVRGYSAESSGNLYALCTERSMMMLAEKGMLSFIVQLPIVSSSRMDSIRDFLNNNTSFIAAMTCDDRPGKLFDGLQHCRSTIFILQHDTSATQSCLWSSGYRRWATEVREHLFSATTFAKISSNVRQGQFPKVASPLQETSYEKIFAKPSSPLGLAVSNQATSGFSFYQESAQYWVKATIGLPYYAKNGAVGAPAHGRYVYFGSKQQASIACAVLNSSLFYTFFIAYGDCFHVSSNLVTTFPLPKSALEDSNLAALSERLMANLVRNAEQKTINTKDGNQISYAEFRVSESKPIIDEIDKVLAEHYGFTEEELDYIINYDIKYRMGKDLQED